MSILHMAHVVHILGTGIPSGTWKASGISRQEHAEASSDSRSGPAEKSLHPLAHYLVLEMLEHKSPAIDDHGKCMISFWGLFGDQHCMSFSTLRAES